MTPQEVLYLLGDRTVAFHPLLSRLTGSVTAGLMLSQALYWTRQVQRDPERDGWFYKSREDWEAETSLGRPEQETARRALRRSGFWQERQQGMDRRLWYRVNLEALAAAITANCNADARATIQPMHGRQSSRCMGGNPADVHTESTTEITTQITCGDGADARAHEGKQPDFAEQATRLERAVENDTTEYLRTLPNRAAVEEIRRRFEWHLAAGHPLTAEAYKLAVQDALKSWQDAGLSGGPRRIDPVLNHLADRINPMPTGGPNAAAHRERRPDRRPDGGGGGRKLQSDESDIQRAFEQQEREWAARYPDDGGDDDE